MSEEPQQPPVKVFASQREAKEFVDAVRIMLDRQARYFRERVQLNLIIAKEAEAVVRRKLKDLPQ